MSGEEAVQAGGLTEFQDPAEIGLAELFVQYSDHILGSLTDSMLSRTARSLRVHGL